MYTKSQKIKTATRLKELRENNGYTFKGLQEAMNEQYKEERIGKERKAQYVSEISLKDWEVQDEYHSKFNKGYGIGIEYICALADVYNVSVDYLLGRTDIPSINHDIQTACKVTGLSENAISKLNGSGFPGAVLSYDGNKCLSHVGENKVKLTPQGANFFANQPKMLAKTVNDILEKCPSLLSEIAFAIYTPNFPIKTQVSLEIDGYKYDMATDRDIVQYGILEMIKRSIIYLRDRANKEKHNG